MPTPHHDDPDALETPPIPRELEGDFTIVEGEEVIEGPEAYIPRLQKRLTDVEKHLHPNHPTLGELLLELGTILLYEDRLDDAEVLLLRCLRAWEAHYGAQHPKLIAPLRLLARSSYLKGHDKEVEPFLERAVNLPWRENPKAYASDFAAVLEEFAYYRAWQKRFVEAMGMYDQAIETLEAGEGRNCRNMAEICYRCAIFYERLGLDDVAEKWLLQTLEIANATTEVADLEEADYREQYATLLRRNGRNEEADGLMALVREAWQRAGKPRHDLE